MSFGERMAFQANVESSGSVGLQKKEGVPCTGSGEVSEGGCGRGSLKWLRFPPGVHRDIRNWERGEIQGRGQELNSRQDRNDVLTKSRWLEMWVWD